MEQAGGAVATGGQGPAEKNNDGEPEVAVSAACAPKAAAAVPASLPRHRRSKSASSDRNAEACKHGGGAEQRCGQAAVTLTPCASKNPPDARRSWATIAGGSVHQGPRDHRPNASPNHRVSLENDVRSKTKEAAFDPESMLTDRVNNCF